MFFFYSIAPHCEYPESYKENTNKEKLVLAYAENFRRQYVHLFRDRKPLFLNPLNECGIEVSYFEMCFQALPCIFFSLGWQYFVG